MQGANLATKYSAKFAENFRISKYVVGFIVVAFISILPETLISINSAFQGIPSFGLGTLLGSNVADLTLIFALLIIFSGRGIKIESKILKQTTIYPLFLLSPIILGLNGYFSRFDGLILVLVGIVFYYMIFKNGIDVSDVLKKEGDKFKNFLFLIFAISLLLLGSYFTVSSATNLADFLNINPILIGMLVVSLGTTMPEFFFSLKSLKKQDDDLAIGDILGSVLADATIVIGILALINPFYFPVKIIYVTGVVMFFSSLILLLCMRSGKIVSKKEGYFLLFFWMCYAILEFLINK